MDSPSTSKCNDSDNVSVGLDKSFLKHLNSGASRVFCTVSLCPKQQEAACRIVCDKSSKGRLLVVDRTGGGGTLILHMTAISVGGIALVIIPLLSLTANQLDHIKHAVQRYGAVYAYHLDECSKHDTKEKLIPKMDEFEYNLSITMFILCLPQYLAENIDFRNALLQCRDREALRLIAVNEAHIYAMQGSTFCEPICVLLDVTSSLNYMENLIDFHSYSLP
jgi:superfamily II DNA helicase RecQ